MVVRVDARGVAVGKRDLNGVIPHLRGSFGTRLGLEHGQRRRRRHSLRERLESFFLSAFVVAGSAGALVAQVCEIVMAGVAVGPGDVHTGAARNVNFHASGLFSRVEGSWHFGARGQDFPFPSQQSPGGIGLPCGQVFGCPRKVQMRASSSGLMMCSNLQACVCASVSSTEKVSLNKRSAKRWRRTTSRARWLPTGVSCTSPFCNATKCKSAMRERTREAGSSGTVESLPEAPVTRKRATSAGFPSSPQTQICSSRWSKRISSSPETDLQQSGVSTSGQLSG